MYFYSNIQSNSERTSRLHKPKRRQPKKERSSDFHRSIYPVRQTTFKNPLTHKAHTRKTPENREKPEKSLRLFVRVRLHASRPLSRPAD